MAMPASEDRTAVKNSDPATTAGRRTSEPGTLTTIVTTSPVKPHRIFLVLPFITTTSVSIGEDDLV